MNESSRVDTGLEIVSGAVSDSVLAPAAAHTRNSSHSPNPGGTRIGRPRLARQVIILMTIGTAIAMKMNSPKPSAHHSGYPATSAATGHAGWVTLNRPRQRRGRGGR